MREMFFRLIDAHPNNQLTPYAKRELKKAVASALNGEELVVMKKRIAELKAAMRPTDWSFRSMERFAKRAAAAAWLHQAIIEIERLWQQDVKVYNVTPRSAEYEPLKTVENMEAGRKALIERIRKSERAKNGKRIAEALKDVLNQADRHLTKMDTEARRG